MTRVAILSLIFVVLTILCVQDRLFLINARECTSIDVRNEIASFDELKGCSVIRGFLLIVLIIRNVSPSDFINLTFPELKEITDFFILHDVTGLTEIRKLFPNLVVIRGRRLFLSYALAVSYMPDLELLEFRSLIAIQRGHIFIGDCPKLCYLNKISFDRLTLTRGKNNIFPMDEAECPSEDCIGCENCWSNRVCQKFHKDNLFNLILGSSLCNKQCLGGCSNSTNRGCNVCKGITDHGACVSECPGHLYYSEHHQRCYTKEECYAVRGYRIGNECNRWCPSGYTHSRKRGECIKCTTGCIRDCLPEEDHNEIMVSSLADAEALKGCQHLKGSLYFQIDNQVEEKDLIDSFSALQEVDGHVKVFYSPHLTSLHFLQNLQKINGKPLENDTYALILFHNQRLEKLWTPPEGKTVEFIDGGIYSFGNYKLCNHIFNEFTEMVVHDKDKDSIQENSQEVICEPVRLYVYEKKISQEYVVITWQINQTLDQLEVIYRLGKNSQCETNNLDDDVCERVHWEHNLVFKSELKHNASHFFYNITKLQPYTSYDYLIKTFSSNNSNAARSIVQRFKTKHDLPTAPKLRTINKSFENITLAWTPRNATPELVTHYILETFEHYTDFVALDARNFCEHPICSAKADLTDNDECCRIKEEKKEDDEFKRDLEAMFVCKVSSRKYCDRIGKPDGNLTTISVIDAKLKNFTVTNLKRFTQYTFFLFACNDLGCGSYYMYVEKTSPIEKFDRINHATACRENNTFGYLLEFSEPPFPNGAVLSYHIHFRNISGGNTTMDLDHIFCITRLEFEQNGYKANASFEDNPIFEQAAIRVVTTAGGGELSDWFDANICTSPSKTHISAFNVFLIVIAVIVLVWLIWFCYRRRGWFVIRLNRWRREAQRSNSTVGLGDRAQLVATFERVVFKNVPRGDGYLESLET